MWPWTTKQVLSHWEIFVAIAKYIYIFFFQDQLYKQISGTAMGAFFASN